MLEGLVEAPEHVGVGTAAVTLSFDAWGAGQVAPTVVDVAIVAPNAAPQLEAVSKRLRGELIHPDTTETLLGVRFSPDGRRLAASEYPGGTVAVWDVASGRVRTTIKTGRGDIYTGLFELSPDWQTLYATWGKRDYRPVEQDGTKFTRWECDGDVRAWDVPTGRLSRTYKHQPPRSILQMRLSTDGTKFLTSEFVPGTYEGRPKQSVSFWDVRTGQVTPVFEGVHVDERFSPDGRLVVVTGEDEEGNTRSLKVLDSVTGREARTIPIPDRFARLNIVGFSPDGQTLVGDYFVADTARKWDTAHATLKWWDIAAGREIASFAGDRADGFSYTRFSADGRILSVGNSEGDECKLKLFRVADRHLAKTLVLGTKTSAGRVCMRERVFSPDGKWLAVITQRLPDDLSPYADPRDAPQPRIHLIEVATGEIRETLVAPQSFMWSACFSPDGRTLATGAEGKTLLWDVSNLTAQR